MKRTSRTKRFFYNSVMLIGVSLLMRAVGMLFNIYVTNKVGAETIGLYSLLSGTYGFCVTVATSGIGLAMTRTVSEALTRENRRGALRALKSGIAYSLFFGCSSGLILFIFAGGIGTKLIGDARTVTSLRVLALTLPAVGVCTCFSGYFTAIRKVSRSSAAQITAQGVKIALTVFLLSLMMPSGMEYACLALVIGGAAAEFISLLISVALYLIGRRKIFGKDPDGEERGITRELLGIALPVAFSAYLRSGLITIEHILIPRGLKKSGASWSASLASFGLLQSLVLPVILFPSAFISSFSGLLVPEIAESRIKNDTERIRRVAFRIFTFAMIFSVGVSGIMICFSSELGRLITNSENADEVCRYVYILAPLIPIMYVDSSVDAILKGMGEQVYSMNVNIIDALSSVILVLILLPFMGLNGYLVTIYLTETLNTALSLVKMLKVTGMKPKLFHQLFGPVICIIGATCASNMIFRLITPALPDLISFVIHIAASIALYIPLLKLTGIIGKDEKEVFQVIFKKQKA